MHFLFCLDLSLHAGAGKKFGILIFVTEHGPSPIMRQGPCKNVFQNKLPIFRDSMPSICIERIGPTHTDPLSS